MRRVLETEGGRDAQRFETTRGRETRHSLDDAHFFAAGLGDERGTGVGGGAAPGGEGEAPGGGGVGNQG